MRKTASLDAAYFDGLYAEKPDPWAFETSDYEARKYDATLAALGDERAARALEVGCSIGVLTRRLAERCDALVATEVSRAALAQAEARCADLDNIDFRLVSGAAEGFDGAHDLIVLSEVVYYWDDADLDAVAASIRATLTPGGRLLLVHYTLETDYPKSGDDAVTALGARLAGFVAGEVSRRAEAYRLDLWRRPLV
jgi:cyclopropane fatty-acyl-phospholipid synthase-like methyltransferase